MVILMILNELKSTEWERIFFNVIMHLMKQMNIKLVMKYHHAQTFINFFFYLIGILVFQHNGHLPFISLFDLWKSLWWIWGTVILKIRNKIKKFQNIYIASFNRRWAIFWIVRKNNFCTKDVTYCCRNYCWFKIILIYWWLGVGNLEFEETIRM